MVEQCTLWRRYLYIRPGYNWSFQKWRLPQPQQQQREFKGYLLGAFQVSMDDFVRMKILHAKRYLLRPGDETRWQHDFLFLQDVL